MRTSPAAALSGVVAAAAGLGVALAGSLLFGADANPITSVGSLVIDLTPPPIKDAVIALFGTGNKPFLLLLLLLGLTAVAAAAGLLEYRRRGAGMLLLAGVTALAAGAVATRAAASLVDVVPTIGGAIAGGVVLRFAITRLRNWRHAEPGTTASAMNRRGFFLVTGGAALGAAILAAASTTRQQLSTAISTLRESIRLPRPADPAPPIPAGADLGVPGLAPFITPNAAFYRIDTALVVPEVDPSTWRLTVNGMVERELDLSFDDLLSRPLVERALTLLCVSNPVGGDLVGNALWLGYPVQELLAEARPRAGADMVLSRSVDGFTAGTPLKALQDPDRLSLIAVGMNGEPLPVEHGFPVRMVVSGLYGYVSATKWLTELTVTRFDQAQGYWTPRGWSAKGPIKIGSRIDTPRQGTTVSSPSVVAGVAWAQPVGVAEVLVRIDDGEWQTATLAAPVSDATWRQWKLDWEPEPGEHLLAVRAIGEDGEVQTADVAPPAPDGATGHHTVRVEVR